MKTIKLSIIALALATMSFTTAPITKVMNGTEKTADSVISWKAESIDLGEIPQNVSKAVDFEFINTGDSAIIITNVKASCGCTATDYTKTPILPGGTAKIKASYNAAAKGAFNKTVTVTTSVDETPKVLTIKGTVI